MQNHKSLMKISSHKGLNLIQHKLCLTSRRGEQRCCPDHRRGGGAVAAESQSCRVQAIAATRTAHTAAGKSGYWRRGERNRRWSQRTQTVHTSVLQIKSGREKEEKVYINCSCYIYIKNLILFFFQRPIFWKLTVLHTLTFHFWQVTTSIAQGCILMDTLCS